MGVTSWANARVLIICLVESAERFSYYGTASLLALFLSRGPPALPPSHSASLVSLFTSLAYFSPLLGAHIAARRGMFPTIAALGAVYLCGMLLLPAAAAAHAPTLARVVALIALLLVAAGTGGIKPNVAAFGALQVGDETLECEDGPNGTLLPRSDSVPTRDVRLSRFFSAFYFVINIGAIGGQLCVPVVQRLLGYAASFLTSALVLALSIVIFLGGEFLTRDGYRHEAPPTPASASDTPAELLRVAVSSRLGLSWQRARGAFGGQRVIRLAESVRALRLLAPLPLFWAGYSAMASVWVLQADEMRLPLSLSASQWIALNPIMVLLTLPVAEVVATAFGIRLEMRIASGVVLGSACLLMSAIVQRWVDAATIAGEKISGLWTLPQWVGLSVAEVLTSVSSLELAHAGAPEALKSAMQAAWLLVSATGNLIAALVFAVDTHAESSLIVLAALMALGAALFGVALREPGRVLETTERNEGDENCEGNAALISEDEDG